MDNEKGTEECVPTDLKENIQMEPACTKRESTEFDAVHPRFRTPKTKEEIEKYQISHDYYCEQCKLFFAPDIIGLKTHFREDMVTHLHIDDCFYCKGPVYAYSFNNQRQIYHNCKKDSS